MSTDVFIAVRFIKGKNIKYPTVRKSGEIDGDYWKLVEIDLNREIRENTPLHKERAMVGIGKIRGLTTNSRRRGKMDTKSKIPGDLYVKSLCPLWLIFLSTKAAYGSCW